MPQELIRTTGRFFDFSRLMRDKDTPLVSTVKGILTAAGAGHLLPLLTGLSGDIDQNWQIVFDDVPAHGYEIDEPEKKLILANYGLETEQALGSPYFGPQILLALAEGLRMARHIEWLEGSIERYHPESILRLGRICVADTATQLLSFAWKAREAGYNLLWKTLLCSHHSDLAATFQTMMERASLVNGDENPVFNTVLSQVFKQWFACEARLTECDHDTLDLIDSLLIDQKIPGDHYLESHAVTCLTLKAGGGSSYIDAAMTGDIIRNPYYISVSDPINQAHLMQIIHDMYTTRIGGVAFRDADLASRFALLQ